MTDHDSPEQVALRKNQGDPIVMYLIVRESLNMSAGKIGAQCGHAAQMVLLKYQEDAFCDTYDPPDPKYALFAEWLKTSFRKIVLGADEKEWAKVKACSEITYVIVRDAGLTEVEAGSETVIGVFPLRKSKAPKVIKRLQAL